jgi:hypothetical protein
VIQSELTGREGRGHANAETGADGGGLRPLSAALGDEKLVTAVGGFAAQPQTEVVVELKASTRAGVVHVHRPPVYAA